MAGKKAKFGRHDAVVSPVRPTEVAAPAQSMEPSQPEPAPVATTLPFAAPAEPPATEPAPKVESVVQAAPAAKDDASVVVAPKPCRRGHVRAKVLVHGLQATGYALDGEYRTRWSKGDDGEFPRESVDGIYLEAL